jgi:hypothetical protein
MATAEGSKYTIADIICPKPYRLDTKIKWKIGRKNTGDFLRLIEEDEELEDEDE